MATVNETTVTKKRTLADALNQMNPTDGFNALKKLKLGRMLSPIKITLAAITAAAAIDITTFKKGDAVLTINSGLADLETGQALPAIQDVKTCRVSTSGTANSVGTYITSDAGGAATSPTASTIVGIALLSDDGKTLTFPTTVTGLVLEYIPRSDSDPTAVFPS